MSDLIDAVDALDPAEIALTAAPAGPGIVLCERFARDGIRQAAPSAAAGIALVDRLAGCGFRRIELAPFTGESATIMEAVLRGLRGRPELVFSAACPDRAALDRALAARDAGWGPDEVSLHVSASERGSQDGLGRSRADQWAELAAMTALIGNAFRVVGSIGAAFDCHLDGPTDPQRVLDDAERFAALGVTRIVIEDGSGSATPPRVRDLIGWLDGALPTATFIARFGDGRGTGIANTLAAIEAGLTHADCALGGGAGTPGDACTEDLATALHAMGFTTGLDLACLRTAGLEAEQLLGRPLRSRVVRLPAP